MRAVDRRIAVAFALTAAVLLAAGTGALRSFADSSPRIENPHGKFVEECSHCHSPNTWKIARMSGAFDHSAYGFDLKGAHASAACTACHRSLDFSAAQTQCASCHTDVHHGEMGNECGRCHGARSFVDRGPMVRMHQLTKLPLSGSHAAIDCESCHKGRSAGQMQFVGTQAECRSCHMAQYQSARSPDHVASGFPLECQTCHSALGWTPARFNHDASRFPLTGAHRAAACTDCHTNGRYAGTPVDCIACHQLDYDGATPNHAASQFVPSACTSCHSTSWFKPSTFDHAARGFALTGAHARALCSSCHGDGVYAGKPTACISCHQSEYDGATPNHAAAGFTPSACVTCHGTNTWSGATFNHDGSWFPIYSGRHRGTWSDCQTCHTNPNRYTDFTCLSCHPHDNKTETDGHHNGQSGYSYTSAACYRCHPRGTGD